MPLSRSVPIAVAALALGAGGAAIIDRPAAGTTTTVTPPASGTAVASVKTTGGLTINQIWRRSRASVVDIRTSDGEGTGFVLNADGDIVTNEHVVSGARTVKVSFAGGREATARVVGTDASTDVAVIRVEGVPSSVLKPLAFADSGKVQVGDAVVAI